MPDRVLQSTPVSLTQQWYEDGVAVDPGTVTVGIDRADGSELVAAGTGTSGSGTAPRLTNLTTTHTALLDRLTATWTSATKGTLVSHAEIVGGFLFGLAEALADPALSGYTAATLTRLRTTAEQELERLCGRAFVPRYELETLNGAGGKILDLTWAKLRSVRAVSVDGTALGSTELAELKPHPAGLYRAVGWPIGFDNIVVGYEHGDSSPLGIVTQAALRLAKHYAETDGGVGIDDRVTRASAGEESFTFAVAGLGGSYFGLPEVDAVVERYGVAPLVW